MKNLDEWNKIWLSVLNHNGLHKRWIYKNKHIYEISCDYLQKMNYAIVDFQQAAHNLDYRANIIYCIVLLSWIFDITDGFIKIPSNNPRDKSVSTILDIRLLQNFTYDKFEYKRVKNYMKALRSFVMAHPLNTSEHSQFGLDGNYFTLETNSRLSAIDKIFTHDEHFKHISLDGLQDGKIDTDIFISVYTNDTTYDSFNFYIGFSIEDVEYCIDVCVNILRELDIYLSKLKRKDFK